MRFQGFSAVVLAIMATVVGVRAAGARGSWSWSSAKPSGACRRAIVEAELKAGQPLSEPIGGGLRVYFQPVASGWILRVLPLAGPIPQHDYAELATPPYQSVSPLSISTDFAFRAQDAVGWNPRHFRFATSGAGYQRLLALVLPVVAAGPGKSAPPALEAALAHELAQTSEGTLTLLDSRLVPGTADQWLAAGAVASHFATTAHTLVPEPDGRTSPLGRLLWLKIRLELQLPEGWSGAHEGAGAAVRLEPTACPRG
jgi:hypothetical protein